MEFAGKWHRFPNGNIHPVLEIQVREANGNWVSDYFLLDTGADRTVLSADFLRTLQLPTLPYPSSYSLGGIGGTAVSVLVDVAFRLLETNGIFRQFQRQFAAFLD